MFTNGKHLLQILLIFLMKKLKAKSASSKEYKCAQSASSNFWENVNLFLAEKLRLVTVLLLEGKFKLNYRR